MLTASSSLSLNTGGYTQQLQQQAQRSVDQASQKAQSLQSQARAARSDAERAQQNANELEVRAGQAQSEASRAAASTQSVSNVEIFRVQPPVSYDQLPEQIASAKADTYSALNTSNTSSANVGSVVNTTA
ncbi:MAG: hypothetical protein KJ850_09985 [Gammaproteobacteria bacterium]|nr:hypothetical protein [Gammaproteobacteria bacterium]MBU1625358.1 hypothetical protein [Gammaproteobacteria bacterium]MBU1981618.1 hypothetical protein [Gammaproteobacteria bacterium]